jgi:simple sugar transport system permease protein
MVLAALFFGALANGGTMIQLFSNIPLDLINLLQGVVMIFAVVDLGRLTLARRAAGHG